jgi:8-oxo-dGTP diphosphatase
MIGDSAPPGDHLQPSIAAAIVVHEGRVLLVRRSVPEAGLVWQFPAGKVEAGESAVEAAVRETRDEVGLRVSPIMRLGERLHPATRRRVIYVACQVDGGSACVAAPAEVADVAWCDRGNLAKLVRSRLHGPVAAYLDGALRHPAGPPPV